MNTKKIISGVLMVVIAFSFLAAVPAANAQVTELWGERYNGGHDDLPWSVAVDSEDNVIVTGWSDDGTANGYNYYTVKYDKNGIEQWSKTYDFCGDHDMAFDVAVDSEDNVIVTGASLKWTYDYYTIKYDKNDGHEIWSQRYDGGHPWPSGDKAFEVAVDSADNVIVAGWTHDGTHYNYYTVKYNKNGVEQWSKTYDGGLDDLLFELAIDSEDSVIVTGFSDTAAAKYDYYTIKYDKNGVEQWSKRYDGSGFDDLAFYLATDSEDNVIVTGWSNDGTDYNYYTIKYGKNGGELWNRTYDSLSEDMAWCVAADSEDNVIVTGFSHGGASHNYFTIKYDRDGNELWNRTYDGGHDDVTPVTVVDSEDNVIVTGMSHDGTAYNYYTIKYDKDGNELWSKSYDGGDDDVNPATVVDSENTVIVTGWSHDGAYYDYYTIKYEVPAPTPKPSIEVNKTVFNEATLQWVNETTVNVNDTVRFRCEVHNNGTCNLMNITVTDILPDSLEYSGNATVDAAPREPNWIAGNQFEWNFTGPLTPCETITIEFDARVIECGAGKNMVNATAWCEELKYGVRDVDSAVAKVLPGIEVEKHVRDTRTEAWVKETRAEVGDEVTFQSWIHHDGTCCPIFGIVVEDVLPEGLEFVSADPVPDEVTQKGNITTVKWNLVNITLEPCENTTVELVANVTKGGAHKNEVSANATGCGYEVSDTDEATVSVPPSIVLGAGFRFEPTEPKVSEDIQFFDETTGGYPPYSFEWDFNNDGIIDSPEANPTWHYTEPGNYTVSLDVNDIKGNTDTVEKKIIVCPAPAIEVNKTVFNETTSQWVNVTTAHINDIMRFRCEVHNNGTCNLMNITVTDILSDSLEYRDNATVDAAPREPDWIAGNQFVWNFTGPLMPCETITIEFDTRVIKCGNDTNTLNATAWCDKTGIFVSDVVKAYVNVPMPMSTTVNETQYLDSISQPIDSSKIRFALYAVNEEWVKDSKWPERPMKLKYWQESTKYSIEIYIDEHGYVTRVDFRRWGFPMAEIPYDRAVRSLDKLNP